MDQTIDHPTPDLQRFHRYLGVLARLQVSPRLRARIDLAGVVQQTLKEAWQSRRQLQEYSEAHKVAWLRRALAHKLADAVRKLGMAQGNAVQERSESTIAAAAPDMPPAASAQCCQAARPSRFGSV